MVKAAPTSVSLLALLSCGDMATLSCYSSWRIGELVTVVTAATTANQGWKDALCESDNHIVGILTVSYYRKSFVLRYLLIFRDKSQ